MMIQDVLVASGGVVIGPAVSTKDALALPEQEVVHCAVLDVKLVDGPSTPVAEALTARGIPFIVATGYEESMNGYNDAPVLQKVFVWTTNWSTRWYAFVVAPCEVQPARADHLLDDGDPVAAATWHRILDAIERLQAKAPTEGEGVH